MSSPTESDPKPTKAEIEQDIERTRERLGDTVDELTARLDVKTRVTGAVRSNPALYGGVAAAVVAGVVALVVWRNRS